MKIFNLLFLISILLLFSTGADAKYRVYKLQIKNSLNQETREITTTLSPETYLSYFEANRAFREISVLDTWMCFANTWHYKPICPNPRE